LNGPDRSTVEEIRSHYSRLIRILLVAVLIGTVTIATLLLYYTHGLPPEERGAPLFGAGIAVAMLPVDLALLLVLLDQARARAVRIAECIEEVLGTAAFYPHIGIIGYKWNSEGVIVLAQPGRSLYVARVILNSRAPSKPPRLAWTLFQAPLGVAARNALGLSLCRTTVWERENRLLVPSPWGWIQGEGVARAVWLRCSSWARDPCRALQHLLAEPNGRTG